MLVLTRRASESGELRSSVVIGDLTLTVLKAMPTTLRIAIDYPGGARSVSVVPYGRTLRPTEGVSVMAMSCRAWRYPTRYCRIGIDAPLSVHVMRDELAQRRAA